MLGRRGRVDFGARHLDQRAIGKVVEGGDGKSVLAQMTHGDARTAGGFAGDWRAWTPRQQPPQHWKMDRGCGQRAMVARGGKS